ncbi:MAG: DEAD/DEAH box helicase [Thermoplasmata archaeon]
MQNFNLSVIDDNILSILKNAGINELTQDQRDVYDSIYAGENVLLIAPTGSGKTEAAIIPILARIANEKPRKIHAIYITPLRALNRDLFDRIKRYGEALGVAINIRHGDSSESERRVVSENPPDLLITTPETLQILFSGKKLREHLKNISTIIIDEIHELVQDERGWQLSIAIERLVNYSGKVQRIGLSATVGNDDEISKFLSPNGDVKKIKSSILKEFSVSIESPDRNYEKESEEMMCDLDYGSAIMHTVNLVNSYNQSLIFVNTRFTAEDIAMRLNKIKMDDKIGVHHGSLSKEIRTQNEQLFKDGKLKALICTSSLELGIDIGGADFVAQFNSPRQVYRLLQRIGRSGHRLGYVSKGAIISGDPVEIEEAASIVDLSKRGIIEKLTVRKNPYVVLANQITSWVYTGGSIKFNLAFETVKRSYAFKDLTNEEFTNFLNFMTEIRMIRFDGEYIHRGSKSLEYFYDNLSMIPDEKIYRVIDFSNKKFIGVLDESFVSQEISEGQTFVMKGITWRVIDIKDDTILVDFVEEIATPPKWVGEDIPVPYDVARNVVSIRGKRVLPEYLNESAKNKLLTWWNQDHSSLNRIRISRKGQDTIIEDWFGTKVNETIGLMILTILKEKGYNVSLSITPYTILFSTDGLPIDEKTIKEILLSGFDIDRDIYNAMPNSRFFTRVFIYTGKKFGIISKGADFSSLKVEKLLDLYRDTIIFEEAIKKATWDYLDIENSKHLLNDIRAGTITIDIVSFDKTMDSYLTYIENKSGRTRLTPTVLNAIKNRLLSQEMIFVCLDCKSSWTRKISEVSDTRCIYCGSVRVTVLRKYEREKVSIIKNGPRTKEEKEFYKKAQDISVLIRTYKKDAIISLAGRGVGYETALRILKTPHSEELYLIRDIAEAELNFAKNKKFWKS